MACPGRADGVASPAAGSGGQLANCAVLVHCAVCLAACTPLTRHFEHSNSVSWSNSELGTASDFVFGSCEQVEPIDVLSKDALVSYLPTDFPEFVPPCPPPACHHTARAIATTRSMSHPSRLVALVQCSLGPISYITGYCF